MKHSDLLILVGQCRDALVGLNHSENDGGALIRAIDKALASTESKPAQVWVLTFDIENSGISSRVFSTEEAALEAVHAHVAEYWASEMDYPIPENMLHAADEYFNRDEPDDSYVLEACEVGE